MRRRAPVESPGSAPRRPRSSQSARAAPLGSLTSRRACRLALAEGYEASTSTDGPSLVNASPRAFVGTGDQVLIPGFVISGSGNLRLLVRAVGPTLGNFGVTGTLADPQITLYRGSTAI